MRSSDTLKTTNGLYPNPLRIEIRSGKAGRRLEINCGAQGEEIGALSAELTDSCCEEGYSNQRHAGCGR